LGTAAKWSLFGSADAIGQYVKVNEQWFRVLGVVSPQLSSQTEVAGAPAMDVNNNIYVPLKAALLRLEDSYSNVRDDIDGIYLICVRVLTSLRRHRSSELSWIRPIMVRTISVWWFPPNCSPNRNVQRAYSIL